MCTAYLGTLTACCPVAAWQPLRPLPLRQEVQAPNCLTMFLNLNFQHFVNPKSVQVWPNRHSGNLNLTGICLNSTPPSLKINVPCTYIIVVLMMCNLQSLPHIQTFSQWTKRLSLTCYVTSWPNRPIHWFIAWVLQKYRNCHQNLSSTLSHAFKRTSAPDCSFLCPSCDVDISTTNIRDQFIHGLHSHTLQAVILRSASTKPGITLTDVIHEAQSYEQSLSDQRSLSTSGTMVQSIQSMQPSPQIVTPSSSSEVYNASEEAHDSEVSAAFNSNRQSSFRRRRPTRNRKPNQLLASPRPCIGCGLLTHLSSQREESCKAWNVRCSSCKTVGHFASVCLWRRSSATTTDIDRSVGQANNLFALSIVAPLTSTVPASVTLLHTLVSHCATQLYLFPDTGANICLAGPDHLNELGIANSITRCDITVHVVGGSQISCFGQIRVRISIGTHHTEQNLFFCRRVQRFFLSCQACKELGIIPPSFPVPPTSPLPPALLTPAELPVLPPPMASLVITEDRPRLPPPPKPTQLPFPPTHENIPLLKNFILDSFISSAFNRSKPFPKLSTPPAHIHLRPNAVPFACHTPALVAAHWEDSVKASLDRDVLAGVLIEVPIGEYRYSDCQSGAHRKKGWTTEAHTRLSKTERPVHVRETHHCRSPFHTACRSRTRVNLWVTLLIPE